MKFCCLVLMIASSLLTFTVREVAALPTCENSPVNQYFTEFNKQLPRKALTKKWHNCIGKVTHFGFTWEGEFKNGSLNGRCKIIIPHKEQYEGGCKDYKKHGTGTWLSLKWNEESEYTGQYKDGKRHGVGKYTSYMKNSTHTPHEYYGEWKNGAYHGHGVLKWLPYGPTQEGTFYQYKFIKAHSTKYSQSVSTSSASLISKSFKALSESQRKQIQSALKSLNLYLSKIDGLYGKITESALKKYNNQKFNSSDLNKDQNVEKLLNALLALDVVPRNRPSDTSDKTFQVASGSGFYVSDTGHIVTNFHVIEGCKDIKAHVNSERLSVQKIASDQRNDLAILKIASAPKHFFALSKESPFPLQEIVVAGYPFGDKVSSTLKFTQGIVSAIAGLGNDYSQMQIDAAIQPGNSGGPILDEYGNVIGVAVAKLSLKKILKDYGVVPENTNFGVKSSAVKNLLEGNGIATKPPSSEVISKKKLGEIASSGTVFLSCWMTMAQINQMKNTKVLFEDMSK